mmetsp:Transcript_11299/g.27116  ORF Transcript_11299/g.27116 Transcript_11299/m.27116 type:complete len:198 (+) Transcript_11299:280-873(+)
MTTFYSVDKTSILHGGGRTAKLMEECFREVMRLVGRQNETKPRTRRGHPLSALNITFYTSTNFIVSRQRLLQYSEHVYRTLAHRWVADGMCVPNSTETPEKHKATLGWTAELLHHAIFGNQPLEGAQPARPPVVPSNAHSCWPVSGASLFSTISANKIASSQDYDPVTYRTVCAHLPRNASSASTSCTRAALVGYAG